MFNTTNVNSKTEIKTPANGIIQRSNEKSFLLKFHQRSTLSDKIFEPNPIYKDKPISIIQIMLIANDEMLAEIVNSEDL